MKHKQHDYKETIEARELFLYATGSGELHTYIIAIVRCLARKYRKGAFDREKAVDLFYPFATAASDNYNCDFGYKFSVQDRFTAACKMVDFYMDNIIKNDL